MKVREQLGALLGKEFALQADEDMKMINPEVAARIDFKKPKDGEVIYRLRQLAAEKNIPYEPSQDARNALTHYLDFKGLEDPMGEVKPMAKPVYNPSGFDLGPDAPPNQPPGGGGGGNMMVMEQMHH